MPSSDDFVPLSTRREKRTAATQRHRRALTAIVGVIVAVLVALVATDTVRLPAAEGPHVGGATTTDPDAAPPGGGGVVPAAPRSLSATAPLRLWIAGDSLAGSLGPSLGETTAATGVVAPVYDSRVSSGLMSPEFFDWPEHATQELARIDPEAVVFVIGTNDAQSAPEEPDVAWRAEYERRVEEMMTLLESDGRTVYWVGAPIMSDDDLSDRVAAVNDIAAGVARRHGEVVYLDAYAHFADAQGEYARSLPDGSGETVRMRADDGIHFTPEGGDWLTALVFPVLDARWRITDQSVPGVTQPIVETEGSSRLPGTSRSSNGSSSGSSGGGGSRSGTTTTTAPVVTTTTGAPASTTTAAPTTTTQSTVPSEPPVAG